MVLSYWEGKVYNKWYYWRASYATETHKSQKTWLNAVEFTKWRELLKASSSLHSWLDLKLGRNLAWFVNTVPLTSDYWNQWRDFRINIFLKNDLLYTEMHVNNMHSTQFVIGFILETASLILHLFNCHT